MPKSSEHIWSRMSLYSRLTEFLSCSVIVWSILLFTEKKKIRRSEHAAGSGKQSSTGVSITTSYETEATHTVLRGNQLYIHLYTNSHSLSPTLMPSSCFPRHIKHTPCPIKKHISSYSINNTSGEKLWM